MDMDMEMEVDIDMDILERLKITHASSSGHSSIRAFTWEIF